MASSGTDAGSSFIGVEAGIETGNWKLDAGEISSSAFEA